MTVYVHPNPASGTNSYLLGPTATGSAFIIDPGSFDGTILHRIEDNRMHLSAILVTKPRSFHISGIKTIRRIYDAQIIAPCHSLFSYPCTFIGDNSTLELDGVRIETIAMPDHSRDSVLYLINGMLFSGDALSAGMIDVSASAYARAILIETIRTSLVSLPPDTVIFSSFGPPTTAAVELASSPDCRLQPDAEP